MSVKIPLYTLLKQIGIFLVVSFLVFRGTFVESNSLGLNLSTGVSLLLSIILWGIINLHTCWLIPGYLFQRRYKKYGNYTLFTLIFKKFTFMIITFKLFVIFAPNIQIRLDFSNHCNDIK